ncbi:MAG: FixH family protein [Deltaproteobacteria bacterium]|nr:FixH family protein [Deltaproteobacteria bacterium]
MKRWSWWLVMLVAVVAFGTAWARDNVVQKKAGDYSVDIKMDKDPPVVGMNHVFVAVKDKNGKAVTDAKVLVTASMPAMPGMPAMENKAEAKLSGGSYLAMIDISMAGSWNMSVRITQGGKSATAKWTVDAR